VGYFGSAQEVDGTLYWAATKERWQEKQIPEAKMNKARTLLQLAKHGTQCCD
jgi:hypothetical protein